MDEIKLADVLNEVRLTEEDKRYVQQAATPEVIRAFLKFMEQVKIAHVLKLFSINKGKDEKVLLKNQYLVEGQVGIINEFREMLKETLKKLEDKEKEEKKGAKTNEKKV